MRQEAVALQVLSPDGSEEAKLILASIKGNNFPHTAPGMSGSLAIKPELN